MLAVWRTPPVDEKLRATLGLLEKLTLRPAEVGPDDVAPLRAAGLSDEAIADAIAVAASFNLIDRIADSLAADPISNTLSREELLAHEARFFEHGYV